MATNVSKLVLALGASLLLIAPPDVFRLGRDGLVTSSRLVGVVYAGALLLWCAGQSQILGKRFSPPQRSFEQTVFLAFLSSVPWSVVEFVSAAAPTSAPFVGLPFAFGMSVALFTHAPYATYDHPTTENRGYWRGMVLYPSVAFALIAIAALIRGRPPMIVRGLLLTAVGWPAGLWAGLILGYRIKVWSAAIELVFGFLRRLARPLVAFGIGYLAIVLVFGGVYGALWKLGGEAMFSGLTKQPGFAEFAYFSLVTAATVGYGDVAPRSTAARLIAGAEIILSLGWTLVVFAALISTFAAAGTTPDGAQPSRRDARPRLDATGRSTDEREVV